MNEIVVEARAVTKRYHDGALDVAVLKGIDFEVKRGESVAILGASGCGKSTLLHLLGGLDQPSAGEVWCCGQALHSLDDQQRGVVRNRYLGFVYQFHHLLPEFSALENIALPVLISGAGRTAARVRADELLTQVGLTARAQHRPAELSGG